MRSRPPSNTCCLVPTRVSRPNGISIGSPILPRHICVTSTQTDRCTDTHRQANHTTCNICSKRPRLCSVCTVQAMQPNNTTKWNMLSSEDKILIKTCGNVKDFLPKADKRISKQKWKDKLWTNFCKICTQLVNQTHCRKCSAVAILNCT